MLHCFNVLILVLVYYFIKRLPHCPKNGPFLCHRRNTQGYHRASCAKQCGLAVFCNAHTHTHTVNDYSELWKVPENGVCCERVRTPISWKQRITLPHMTFDGLYCAHHGNRFGLRCGSLPSGLGGVGGWCKCRCRRCGVNRYCGSGSEVRPVLPLARQ